MKVIYMIKAGKSASAGGGGRAYRQTQIYVSLREDAHACVCVCVTEHVLIAVLTSIRHRPSRLTQILGSKGSKCDEERCDVPGSGSKDHTAQRHQVALYVFFQNGECHFEANTSIK